MSEFVGTAGPPPDKAEATVVLVHGRGATAESMVSLYDSLGLETLSAIAPQAAGNSWYPNSFLAPLESNRPHLDSALTRLNAIVEDLVARGVPSQRIAVLGFSQGACLALEFCARYPRQYGAVIGLTGGLIGPPGTPRNYPGTLDGTPVFLGASDPDPYVPFERVQETAEALTRMGAEVELRRYPGMPHVVSEDELDACRELLRRVIGASREARP